MLSYPLNPCAVLPLLQFGFMFIALIWKFDFSPFMVLIIAILNDGKLFNSSFSLEIYIYISSADLLLTNALFLWSGTIMTISKDRVKPSPTPDSWKLKEIFATGVVLGGYLALMTVIFFWVMRETDFFSVSDDQDFLYLMIYVLFI